jgi:hypothetical protein
MNSWKTTLFGLMAIIGGGIVAAFELKPALLTGFPTWLPGLGFIFSTIGSGGIGLAARDNNRTSEQVGAGPNATPGVTRGMVSLLIVMVMLSGFCAGLSLVSGCGMTPQQASYRAAGVTVTTVDAAMTAWGDYVKQFHPPASQEMQVKAAFEKYQAVMLAVIDANTLYVTLAGSGSTNSPPVLDAAAKVAAVQMQASQAYADLLSLLTQFGVKL